MGVLLRLETPFALIEVSGTRTPRAVLLDQPIWPIPHVSAGPESSRAILTKVFPLLFEEVDYEILAQSLIPGAEISVQHRDERTIRALRSVPNAEPSTVLGTIRFRQTVGLSTFIFEVDGRRVDLTFEVFPAKLDYLDDYEAMVSDVRDLDRALPLRYFDETHRKSGLSDTDLGSNLEWLTILRSQLIGLSHALHYAEQHPLLSLEQHERTVRPDRIRRVTGEIRRSVARGRGVGGWDDSLAALPLRSRVPVDLARDSLDSVEHRWLRGSLGSVTRGLSHVVQSLQAELDRRRRRYRTSAPRDDVGARSDLEQQIDEVHALSKLVSGLSNLSIIREASSTHVPPDFSSLRLLRTPGYADAYRSLVSLRLGLSHLDGHVEVSIARLGALYEAWCFVEVIRQVGEQTGVELLGGLDVFLEDGSLGTRLIKGKTVDAEFRLHDGRRLKVRYNRSYPGLTGTHVPDIELAFSEPGHLDLVVILDAKYRLDASDEQIGFYGVAAPPQEAIGALHRYRDAIVVDRAGSTGELFRPVVRGAALYPLSLSQSATFPQSRLRRALETYGIGAIPLLPGNTGHLESWLFELLSMPRDELSWNGPPGPTAP